MALQPLALIVFLLCGPLPARQVQATGTAEGQVLPDLELPLVGTGGTLRLRGEAGDSRPILLVTFASW